MASKRATKIDAMLRHLAAGEDIQNFPGGTKFENRALMHTVERRGLVAWDPEGNRYTLTPAGWGALTPRRFGVTSLMVSTAVGAAVGAAALALLWLPGLPGRGWAYGTATAPLPVEKPVVAAASPPADVGGRSIAPMTVSAAPAAPAPVSATAPGTASAAPIEPTEIAVDPPATDPAPAIKQAAVKKHHRRTARRVDPANPFANPWRTRESSYSHYGQGSWYTYR
jgi:hypothetical protein